MSERAGLFAAIVLVAIEAPIAAFAGGLSPSSAFAVLLIVAINAVGFALVVGVKRWLVRVVPAFIDTWFPRKPVGRP
jgi:hypothetical protein